MFITILNMFFIYIKISVKYIMTRFIKSHRVVLSVLLFLVIFYSIQYTRPACLYTQTGAIREFGVGFANKTILPIWLLSIFLGVLSYLTIKYISIYSHLRF
jgi:hypothetical protein